MAEALNGTYKAELIRRHGPWRTRSAAEFATIEWIDWSRYAGSTSGSGGRVSMGDVAFMPCLVRSDRGGGCGLIRVGHPLLDAYLELVAARGRPNTVLAQAYDLKAATGRSGPRARLSARSVSPRPTTRAHCP